jgi:hypothetical protein
MTVPLVTWWLPRPKPDRYKGGFPLWFEEKLLTLYGFDYKNEDLSNRVLQMFAGMTKYGYRVDINPEVRPDMICDCHDLPLEWTDKFDMVILDPPYSDEESEELYGTKKLHPMKYLDEAVRVTKPNGYIVAYHKLKLPRPEGTIHHRIICVINRTWHQPRICCIFKKGDGEE